MFASIEVGGIVKRGKSDGAYIASNVYEVVVVAVVGKNMNRTGEGHKQETSIGRRREKRD